MNGNVCCRPFPRLAVVSAILLSSGSATESICREKYAYEGAKAAMVFLRYLSRNAEKVVCMRLSADAASDKRRLWRVERIWRPRARRSF